MRKIYYKSLFFLTLVLILFILINKETTRKIAINNEKYELEIPVYMAIYDFFNRHYNYKYLVKHINYNLSDKKNIILNTAKWVNQNIQSIPKGVDIVDSDPLTIVKRRLGAQYQFSDIFCVFLVYLDIDTYFFNITDSLTLFKVENYWTAIDPYYGVYFINEKGTFASLEELKTSKWQIVNLDSEKINPQDIKDIFMQKFQNDDQVKQYYQETFYHMSTSDQLDEMNIFNLGGRAYIQKPLNRLKYEIYKILN